MPAFEVFGLSFAEPLSLVLLLVLAPLWWIWRLESRRRQAADAAYGGGDDLRLGSRPVRRRWQRRLVAVAVVLLVLAIARPQWGSEESPATQRGVDVAIALDVSRSMTTGDVPPSRAVAAANGISDFLTHLRSDRVGLVIFSGRAFERSPLTLDLEALDQLVAQAQRDSELVGQGTDLGGAIDESLALLDVPDAAESQLAIVVSDGEDLGEDALDAAGRAAEAGIPVYTVAVGTDEGGTIPGDEPDVGASRADRETLRAVAAATGAEFRELDTIAGLAIEVQRLRQTAFGDDTGRQPIERFQWFVAPAILLLILAALLGEAAGPRLLSRRRLATGALAGVLVLAACGGSQVYQRVNDGNEHYAAARYDEALLDYREALLDAPGDPTIGYDVGNTLHQLRRYEEAAVAASDALTRAEDAGLAEVLHYSLGNHAVMRGALEDARRQYVEALRLDPGDEEAKANLEYVLALIEPPPVFEEPPAQETPAPTPDTGDEPGDEPGGGPGDQPSDGENPGDQPSEPDTPGDQPGEQPGEQPNDTETTPGQGSEQDGEPGNSGTPSGGSPSTEQGLTLEEAQAALDQALDELGQGDLTLEEAQALLDLLRQLNEVNPLEGLQPDRGGFADR